MVVRTPYAFPVVTVGVPVDDPCRPPHALKDKSRRWPGTDRALARHLAYDPHGGTNPREAAVIPVLSANSGTVTKAFRGSATAPLHLGNCPGHVWGYPTCLCCARRESVSAHAFLMRPRRCMSVVAPPPDYRRSASRCLTFAPKPAEARAFFVLACAIDRREFYLPSGLGTLYNRANIFLVGGNDGNYSTYSGRAARLAT
jgi:hypothetical protein